MVSAVPLGRGLWKGALFFWLGLSALTLGALPSAAAVANYGDNVLVEPTEEEQAALDAISEQLRAEDGNNLRVDARLILAARTLALQLQADLSKSNEVMSSKNVNKLMSEYGVYENAFKRQFFLFGTSDDIQAQIRLIPSATIGYTNIGVGVALPRKGREGVAFIIFSEQRVALSPFPKQVKVPSSWALRGKLVYSCRGFTARVLVTPPAGEVQALRTNMNGDAFSASVPFNKGPGTYRVEVVARGEGTSKVAALMEVTAAGPAGGVSATFEVSGFDSSPQNEAQAESMMLDMLNQVRAKEGLAPLGEDLRFKDMAKAHSADMKKNQYVGHMSPEFGSVQQRAADAGLAGWEIVENAALDINLAQVMNNLLKSPAHRAPIIDPEINTVGIGIAFDDSTGTRQYYVTQEFTVMR
jgi:uncharacterized protein YkwD